MKYFTRGCKKLHREVWKYYYGDIPKGFHIHHIDENPKNNDISNLKLLSDSEHKSLHMQERMQNPAYIQELKDRMAYARKSASKWHGSEEGLEWHREHAKNTIGKIQPQKFICEHCGKEFWRRPVGKNKFCSHACKTASRKKSGIDNEVRRCVVCGKEFITNKHFTKKTCCRTCKNMLLSQTMRRKYEDERCSGSC